MQQNVTPRGRTRRGAKDKATKEERENGFQEGQIGIIAKEVVDAHHSAHNGTAVGAGGKACQTSLTNTTALLRPSTGCAESSGTRGVYTTARRKQGEYVQGMVCIRCRAQRSVRIDARNGDRLGSGGYDYQAAPG